MSSIPKVDKSKYNHKKSFAWVDSQWEKFMNEQKEMKRVITQLQEDLLTCNKYFQKQREELEKSNENFRRLERLYTFGTPTDGLEVGSPEDYGYSEKTEKYIYESPDNGRTIYRREFGKDERVLVEGFRSGHDRWEEVPRIPEDEDSPQLELFPPNDLY